MLKSQLLDRCSFCQWVKTKSSEKKKKCDCQGTKQLVIYFYPTQRQTLPCVIGEDTNIVTIGPDIQIQIKLFVLMYGNR